MYKVPTLQRPFCFVTSQIIHATSRNVIEYITHSEPDTKVHRSRDGEGITRLTRGSRNFEMADTVVQDIVDVQPEVEMNQTDGSYVTEFQDQSASNGAEAQETVIQDVQTGETETSMETGDQPADVGADTGVPEGDRKLFIGGLNVDTTETTLTTYFETFGEITSLNIKKNPYNGRSKCFGFLEFKDPASLTKVIESGPHTVDGKQIDAKKAMPPELYKEQQLKNMKTCKIFCGGVPTDLEKEKIEEHFKQYGDIREVAIVTEKQTGKRRGFVFVEFMKEESADKATETDFHEVAGISIEVKKATPREMTARPPRGGGGSYGYRGGRGGGGQWGPQYDPYYGGGPYGYYGSPYGYGGYGGYGGGYGGGFGYEYFGGGGGGRGGGGGGRVDDHGSRYGPMKSYGHGSHGGQYHPYSR